MSLKNVKQGETNRVTLEIVIPKDQFDAEVTKVYRKEAKRITIPGFRKGKAPRSIIEKMYGKGVFYEDALNALLPDVLEEAVKEAGIEAVSSPDLELGEIDENGVALTATYWTKPEITVKSYKGLKAEKTVRKAEKAEVESELERVRQRNSRTIEVTDRAAKKEDIAIIDYEGKIGGKAFEGGKDEGHRLKLGSGQFIPGFEEQIVGHKIGDEFDVTVTFPDDYHAEDLQGKEAVFSVALNGIETVELPVLDDEFAKDVSEFDTLSAYKKDIEAKINDRYAAEADRQVEEQLLDGIIGSIEGEIPEVMYDTECDNMFRDYENRLMQQGLSMDRYLKYTGSTPEKIKEEFRPQAERQVKAQLALEAIAKAEKIEVTEEEVDAEYKRLAGAYGLEEDKVKTYVPADSVKKDVAAKRAVEAIKASAKITEKAYVAEAKAAPKKPAAKKSTAKKAEGEKPAAEKKPAAKKAPVKAAETAKKPVAKKASAKTAEPAKKTAAKKPAAKKTESK